ncbi:MAG: hypothetical protein MRY49_00815 [Candidatus Pacebacteria bacterium]|nr:hypothetical protein [Candidatus Paceibacterota bacterium]
MSIQRIFIHGAPYSGVDEIAEDLAGKIEAEFIHFAKILKEHIVTLDRKIAQRQGTLVRCGVSIHDDFVGPVVQGNIRDMVLGNQPFVVSGYPRLPSQVGMLEGCDDLLDQKALFIAIGGLRTGEIFKRAGRVHCPTRRDLKAIDRADDFNKIIGSVVSAFGSHPNWTAVRLNIKPDWSQEQVLENVCELACVPSSVS